MNVIRRRALEDGGVDPRQPTASKIRFDRNPINNRAKFVRQV
jgi:hypothetical protein